MRWEVTGSDRASGASVLRVYEAPTEEAAAEFATRDGMAVAGVDLLIEMGGASSPPAYNAVPPPPVRAWRVEGAERESGNAVIRRYDAQTDGEAAALAREDGLHVLRVTRADQPAPPPLDAYQAQFAAITAPADPLALRDDPPSTPPAARAADAPAPADGPPSWAVEGFSSASPRGSAIPNEFRRADPPASTPAPAPAAPSGGYQPLDATALAAIAASPDVAPEMPYGSGLSYASTSSRRATPGKKAEAPEPEQPRLQHGATATFVFACAAYAVGGAAALAALIAGIVALTKQGTPDGASAQHVAIVAAQVAGPSLFAAVIAHAVSGACLGLLEIILRRRRKREY